MCCDWCVEMSGCSGLCVCCNETREYGNYCMSSLPFSVSPRASDSLHWDDTHSHHILCTLHIKHLSRGNQTQPFFQVSECGGCPSSLSVHIKHVCQCKRGRLESQQRRLHQTGILLHFCYDCEVWRHMTLSLSLSLYHQGFPKARFGWILRIRENRKAAEKQTWASGMLPSVTGFDAVSTVFVIMYLQSFCVPAHGCLRP